MQYAGKKTWGAADYHAALDRFGVELQKRADQMDNTSATDMQVGCGYGSWAKDWGAGSRRGKRRRDVRSDMNLLQRLAFCVASSELGLCISRGTEC